MTSALCIKGPTIEESLIKVYIKFNFGKVDG